MKTPLLDEAYQTKTWTHLGAEVFGKDDLPVPILRHVSGLDSFACDSERAGQIERRLESGTALWPGAFIFDLELLAAAEDTGVECSLNSGGSVGITDEPWEGHPVGSYLLSVYARFDAEGQTVTSLERLGTDLGVHYFIAAPPDDA